MAHSLNLLVISFILQFVKGIMAVNNNNLSSIDKILLARDLIDNYPASGLQVIPYHQPEELPIVVNCSLQIMSFEGIDDVSEQISFIGDFYFQWTDPFLKSPQYDNFPSLFSVDFNKIWYPQIALADDPIDMFSIMAVGYKYPLIVETSTGRIQWFPSARFASKCQIDLSKFPFDSQTCKFELVSWFHNSSDLVLKAWTANVSFASENSKTASNVWLLEKVSIQKSSYFANYSALAFIFHCRRKPTYYFFNILIPMGLLSFLQMGGLLYPHGPERPNFFLVLLLTFWVIQQVTSSIIPKTSNSCAIANLLSMQSVFAIVVTTQSIIGCKIYERKKLKKGTKVGSTFDWLLAVHISDIVLFVISLGINILPPIIIYS